MTKLARAEVTLPNDREVQVRRAFKAPRALVWKAYTEPDLVKRWMLGPPGWSMPVCEMDLKVGGKFAWRWRSESGDAEFGFSGEFREVEDESRVVHTQFYDPGSVGGPSGDPALVVLELQEDEGLTTVTTRIDFGSKEGREAALSSGMTEGMEMGYRRLDQIFAAAV